MKEHITILNQVEKIRRKSQVIFGGMDKSSLVFNALKMVISVFADPAFGSKCKSLGVIQKNNGFFEVRAEGCSIYVGNFEKSEDFGDRIFGSVEAGDKFGNNPYLSYFEKPTRQNTDFAYPINLAAVQLASSCMEVTVLNTYEKQTLAYENGWMIDRGSEFVSEDGKYTVIKFRPEPAVFGDTQITDGEITAYLKDCALLNPGLKCEYGKGNGSETFGYTYEKGAVTLLENILGNNADEIFTITKTAKGRERYDRDEYSATVKLTVAPAKGQGTYLCYHNFERVTGGGDHLDAVLKALGEEYGDNLALVLESNCKKKFTCLGGSDGDRLCNRLITEMSYDLALLALQKK